ncbi:BAG family molecular chaperone regulator 2 [Euphorbia peplus]|nr:BAG family molecular chaperone regulator 2 [Euphorbia peplus]
MMKLKCKRFCRGSFKFGGNNKRDHQISNNNHPVNGEIKWEVRPGGMLVQKRDSQDSLLHFITITVSTLSLFHHISIEPTSTFGELKSVLSMITGLEPREQRVLYKGKERDDKEHLHMVGIKDKDKVLLLEDPSIKEIKLHAASIQSHFPITV